MTTGANEQTVRPHEQPARAAAQQRTVQTPAGTPTEPAGDGSAMDRVLLRGLAAALAVLAVAGGVLAIWLGARMLAIPAIMLPLIAVWVVLQERMAATASNRKANPRPAHGAARSRVSRRRSCSWAASSR